MALLIGLLRLARPPCHRSNRTFQGDPVIALAAHQQRSIDIACVHKVLGGQQPLCGQTCVDVRRSCHVRLHRRTGHNMCNQMGRIVITCLSDMHLVAGPLDLSLRAVMHLRVIGRLQAFAYRRQFRASTERVNDFDTAGLGI